MAFQISSSKALNDLAKVLVLILLGVDLLLSRGSILSRGSKDTLMILKFMKVKLLIECLVSLFSCFLESGDRF